MRIFKLWVFILSLIACSPSKQIEKSAHKNVLNDPSLQNAHVGISIYDPSTSAYLYNYQGDKYFIPASNTKIPTCYAAMKYLGDSLVGIRYAIPEETGYRENSVVIQPTGDPTFMLPEFKNQPVHQFLSEKLINEKREPALMDTAWRDTPWGSGWSWNDFEEPYMAERNSFPIHGNTVTIELRPVKDRLGLDDDYAKPVFFNTGILYFDSLLNNTSSLYSLRKSFKDSIPNITLNRNISGNEFVMGQGGRLRTKSTISFVTAGSFTTLEILKKAFNLTHDFSDVLHYKGNEYTYLKPNNDISRIHINNWTKLHSQPTDSMLKPMMHRSDNFFAEQSLLMVSNEKLGIMNDARIVDTLLKTDFKDLPHRPRWADGSGLSRYNLFTPQSLVVILNKMRMEFGMERLQNIFPTGNEGTLTNYYKPDSGYIYAKTGTLSGVVALSGFLYTKKGRVLIFSILVNNHQASAPAIRRTIEKFIHHIRGRF